MLFVPLGRVRRDRIGGELLRHFLDLALFVGEIELAHLKSAPGVKGSRRRIAWAKRAMRPRAGSTAAMEPHFNPPSGSAPDAAQASFAMTSPNNSSSEGRVLGVVSGLETQVSL